MLYRCRRDEDDEEDGKVLTTMWAQQLQVKRTKVDRQSIPNRVFTEHNTWRCRIIYFPTEWEGEVPRKVEEEHAPVYRCLFEDSSESDSR
jgi:hypothetical protein